MDVDIMIPLIRTIQEFLYQIIVVNRENNEMNNVMIAHDDERTIYNYLLIK